MPLSSWLSSLGRDLGQGLVHLVYPGLCHLCGRSMPPGSASFCSTCHDALLGDTKSACPRCASTIGAFVPAEDGCPHCRNNSFAFESALRLGPYEGVWRDAVLLLKHHRGEGLAELLGELWGDQARAQFRSVGADAIVPVPLHWWRQWRRGYNQSAAIARGLSVKLGIPCRPSWLRRKRHTPIQPLLSPTARRENIRGAFRATRHTRVHGATVLLVDDVMTTGSTAHEAAAVLHRNGAARVIVAALSRATP